MTAIPRVPLGASTLNRKWFADIDTSAAPHTISTWTPVGGILEFKPSHDQTLKEDSDFDSGGYTSSTVSALGWKIDMKVARKVTAASATEYDPGQEALRNAAEGMGVSNRVHMQWYEMPDDGPRVEAYAGFAVAGWSEEGGAMDALDSVSVVLTGSGVRNTITHPDEAI